MLGGKCVGQSCSEELEEVGNTDRTSVGKEGAVGWLALPTCSLSTALGHTRGRAGSEPAGRSEAKCGVESTPNLGRQDLDSSPSLFVSPARSPVLFQPLQRLEERVTKPRFQAGILSRMCVTLLPVATCQLDREPCWPFKESSLAWEGKVQISVRLCHTSLL